MDILFDIALWVLIVPILILLWGVVIMVFIEIWGLFKITAVSETPLEKKKSS